MLKRDANHRTRFDVEPSSVFFGERGGQAKASDSFNTKNQRGLVPPRIAKQSSPHVVGQAHDKVDFFHQEKIKNETTKQTVEMDDRSAFAMLGFMECSAFRLKNRKERAGKTQQRPGSKSFWGGATATNHPKKEPKNKGLKV